MEKLYRRKIPSGKLVTEQTLLYLTKLSAELGRQVAILADRKGKVTHVILGDDRQIVIPEIRHRRTAGSRLAGLRCIHTHVKGEAITQDDLNDLLLLRLDAMVAVNIRRDGSPGDLTMAHISTESDDNYLIHGPTGLDDLQHTFAGLVPQLEAELDRQAEGVAVNKGKTAMLVHVSALPREAMERSLFELGELARTAGFDVAGQEYQRKAEPDPRFLMGKGKLKDFMVSALGHGINLVIFDTELAPAQLKAISDFTDIEVMDRTQLILTIFERRATSRDGKVRVQLAQLRYLLPRLAAKESALSRIRGGIGLRGPGETTAEVQRRTIQQRIRKLERELEDLKRKREVKRKARKRSDLPALSVIGYTNAGKSTLLNRLTGSDLFTEDLLFATLDPAVRRLRLPSGREAVISDTVGLIRNMPASVMGAFRATFEELFESDLLLHVVDASDPEFERHIAATREVMEEIGLNDIPLITLFNKADIADRDYLEGRCKRFDALPVSALSGEGIKELLKRMDDKLGEEIPPLSS